MTSKNLFNVNLHDFDKKVIQTSETIPVLVDFWANWCEPCIVIAPILEKIINDYNGAIQLAMLEVDKDENMKLAGKYQIRGFPTIIFFERGIEIERFSSAQSYSYIDQFIQQHCALLK